MKLVAVCACALVLCGFIASAEAKDVYVRGYTTKNGTYVAPYVRSSPNGTRADNYGPKMGAASPSAPYGLLSSQPRTRDADKDGTPNFRDRDDNNNFIHDDLDRFQYRQKDSLLGR